MMQLAVQSKAPALQAFDQVDLPQRAVEVHRVRMQARNEDAQLALAAGIGQCRMPQVILQVDLVSDLERGAQTARPPAG